MRVTKTVKSYDKGTGLDVFGHRGESMTTYVMPLSNNGSESNDNRFLLTSKSHYLKGDKTKGKINGIQFAIQGSRAGNGKMVGVMYIRDHSMHPNTWKKVVNK